MGRGRIKTRYLLLVAAALCVLAAPAQAQRPHLSKQRAAHIRATLRKQVRHNPRVVRRRSFLKKAALVDFKLPVTLRLRPGGSANADLGASLGNRSIVL